MIGTVIPTIGRIVHYQTDGRGGYRYSLPAMVVRTRSSTDPKAVEAGHVADLADDYTVDLLVFSCAGESYGENGVPYAPAVAKDAGRDEYGPARSWRWPPRA